MLADIARAALDNATTFRLLNTLVMLGYVEKPPTARRFRLTLKCLDLGFNAIAHSDVRRRARSFAASSATINEAASIGVLEGADVVYIERMQAGMRGWASTCASAAACRCTPPPSVTRSWPFFPAPRRRRYSAAPRRKVTEKTVTDVRRSSSASGRCGAGLCRFGPGECPGTLRPGRTHPGHGRRAGRRMSVAAPAFRMSAQAFEKAGALPLLEAAQALSRGLHATGGFRDIPPTPDNCKHRSHP